MSTLDLPAILSHLAPGAQWAISGEVQTAEDYASALIWLEDSTPPGWDQVVAAADTVAATLALQALRDQRDTLLAASDVLVLIDRWEGYSDSQRSALSAYRQTLRDLPAAYANDPAACIWPDLPLLA